MKNLKKKKYGLLRFIAKYSFILVIGFSILFPIISINAACPGDPGCPPAGTGQEGAGTGSGGVSFSIGIENPLGDNIKDIPSFIEAIINIVLVIGVPIVALAIIYTGFLFVQARGNSEELTKAKKALLYTIIGAALLLGSFVIAQAIKTTVDDIKSNA